MRKKKQKEIEKIIQNNKKFGIDRFSAIQQCEMLYKHNFKSFIKDESDEKYFDELLDFYFDIDINDMIQYLVKLDYYNYSLTDSNDRSDGWKIITNPNGSFDFVDEERGKIFIRKTFTSKDQFYVYIARKILSKVPKFSHLIR